jgi:beta-glucosidase
MIPNPPFYWGVGIENCWMAQADPARDGERRLLDVFLQMDHYRRWKEDLDLLPETGVNCIRYSVPWYLAEPQPGVYDWRWIDEPVDYLVNALHIIPIMDLIHYGAPTWMPDGVADEHFPEAIARYAEAMAVHFRGLVNHYTPHNEPQITARFCGLTRRWPPYRGTPEAWTRIGLAVARGMVWETQAIRAAIPDAVILSCDAFMAGIVDAQVERRSQALDQAFTLASGWYPASLAYGTVARDHPMTEFLLQYGAKESELDWFQRNAAPPDIQGCNAYPDFSFGWANEPPQARVDDYTRKGVVPLAQAVEAALSLLTASLRRGYGAFGLPVYLTETSAGLSVEARVAYIEGLGRWARQMRRQGMPLRGVNWWPLFDTIQWDYREKPDLPLADFIYEGGWNNGLYRVQPQPDGALQRVATPAVAAYRATIEPNKTGEGS